MMAALVSNLFTPVVVLITSCAAAWFTLRFVGATRDGFGPALLWVVEAIGLTMFFYLLNTITGLLLVDLIRLTTHVFVSHYAIQDGLLTPFCMVQAVLTRQWIGSVDRH